jgi:hypothetical protein
MLTDQQMLVSFFNTHKKELKELAKDIQRISTEDKKRMVEAMLDGPIIVDFRDPDPDNPDDGSGPDLTIPWKFNPEILEKFSDEGKLRLDKDSTDYYSQYAQIIQQIIMIP